MRLRERVRDWLSRLADLDMTPEELLAAAIRELRERVVSLENDRVRLQGAQPNCSL